MYGWEEWEVLEPNPDHSGPGFPQEHLGSPVGEGEGASTAMGEGVGGAAERLSKRMGECEENGRCKNDGGSDRMVEGDGGVGVDDRGGGGSNTQYYFKLLLHI